MVSHQHDAIIRAARAQVRVEIRSRFRAVRALSHGYLPVVRLASRGSSSLSTSHSSPCESKYLAFPVAICSTRPANRAFPVPAAGRNWTTKAWSAGSESGDRKRSDIVALPGTAKSSAGTSCEVHLGRGRAYKYILACINCDSAALEFVHGQTRNTVACPIPRSTLAPSLSMSTPSA
jgi:ubiquitin